jgi:hypothetical protein
MPRRPRRQLLTSFVCRRPSRRKPSALRMSPTHAAVASLRHYVVECAAEVKWRARLASTWIASSDSGMKLHQDRARRSARRGYATTAPVQCRQGAPPWVEASTPWPPGGHGASLEWDVVLG